MNYFEVRTCVNGDRGNELMWSAGVVATDKLEPPMKYVPWVLVNDVLYDINDDFKKFVESAYEVN